MAVIEGKRLKTVSVTKEIQDTASAAYVAGEVVSDNSSGGTIWTFSAIAKVDGGTGYIVKAHVISETTSITPRLTLFLFNAAVTAELDDQAANTQLLHTDLAKYVGKIDFPAMEDLGSGVSEAVATPSTTGNLPLAFECAAAADDLYGVLVTRDAFIQVAAKDMTIRITAEQY